MVPGKVFSQTYVSIPLSSFLFCIQYHGKVEINIPTHNLLSRIKTYGIMYSDGNSLMIEGKKVKNKIKREKWVRARKQVKNERRRMEIERRKRTN
jgi:hypothetical protein